MGSVVHQPRWVPVASNGAAATAATAAANLSWWSCPEPRHLQEISQTSRRQVRIMLSRSGWGGDVGSGAGGGTRTHQQMYLLVAVSAATAAMLTVSVIFWVHRRREALRSPSTSDSEDEETEARHAAPAPKHHCSPLALTMLGMHCGAAIGLNHIQCIYRGTSEACANLASQHAASPGLPLSGRSFENAQKPAAVANCMMKVPASSR